MFTTFFALIMALMSGLTPNVHDVEPVSPAPVSYTSWADTVLSDAGIVAPDNTIIALTNEHNCGALISTIDMGGCTYHLYTGQTVIVVSPQLAYTPTGQHILLHEIGHAYGLQDECAAEYFAHNWSDNNIWSYPYCENNGDM